MKAKMLLTGFILTGIVSLSFAQVENDDMYFTASDRVKLNASKASADSYAYNKKKKQLVELTGESPNPTDSYSARNINPEYASRQNSKVAKLDEQDYFVANYNYQSGAQYNNWYNSYSSWNNNPWYSMPACLPAYGYSAYGNPYYGYNGYSNPWGNPYYYDSYYGNYPGTYAYYGGSSWGYGMNAYRPFGSGWGIGGGIGWAYNAGYYAQPQYVVVVNNYGNTESRQVTYGKRTGRESGPAYTNATAPSRSRNDVRPTTNNTPFTRTTAPTLTTTTTQRQEDYYNRSYRNSQQTAPARSSWSNSNNSSNGRTSSYNNNNSWSGSNSNSNSTPSYTPSRSSSTSGGSSGGATYSPGSGSNGRSRGGN